MKENENSNESISKRHHWYWMCGGRSSGIFWGILFIVVGLFWFGKKADWVSLEQIAMFWPIVLIIIGVWVIVGTLLRRKK
jgi:hypothetical protein